MTDRCRICHSYAINPHLHGRDPAADLDLCDVCYWRERAQAVVRDVDERTCDNCTEYMYCEDCDVYRRADDAGFGITKEEDADGHV